MRKRKIVVYVDELGNEVDVSQWKQNYSHDPNGILEDSKQDTQDRNNENGKFCMALLFHVLVHCCIYHNQSLISMCCTVIQIVMNQKIFHTHPRNLHHSQVL